MKSAVIVFPGSNCDRDVALALTQTTGRTPTMIWHRESALPPLDLIVIPGGFSYGDYLRCGAIAAHSPVMRAVKQRAAAGVLVLGICNGFQVLTEAGLLPGALMRNEHLRFLGRDVFIRTEQTNTPYTAELAANQVLRMPIAHGEGNYFADDDVLDELERNEQIVFRYCDAEGRVTAESNPNGSARNIAGICNRGRNVMGLMPHPERCSEPLLGNTDGLGIFKSIVASMLVPSS
jgi:phosphoribosylformylglycinamidine synthase I